ncbi:invasion associated locus B family protein [Roseivivax sediminis]|uniref:Invasion protein IalB, involved in pathogenesis n=1 Tax=Roseivivax sediminis TaxID=936889 RepID=A0A1I1Z8Z6_9RHOB|nr:invasion associated locus B family protein [Roseivivax sediminis]SFE28324.1 Invasion protein IalB, involved in pathogenesis [Roseivivax sediminis]
MFKPTALSTAILLLVAALVVVGPVRGTAQDSPAEPAPDATTEADGAMSPDVLPEPPDDVANGQSFGAWRVACQALTVNRTACTLSQRIRRSADNAFVADILALPQGSEDGGAAIIARVPTGAHLPSGFVMRGAEGEAQHDFTWQVCGQDMCEALISLSAEEVAALEEAEGGVTAAFRPSVQAEPFFFRFSFAGAGEGLEALSGASEG